MEQNFMSTLKRDYNLLEKKKIEFIFQSDYIPYFVGTAPDDLATHKRWWFDIDNLYGCVHINGNHWVAVDINFRLKKYIRLRLHSY